MASPSLLRSSARANLYVCAQCSLRARKSPTWTSKRWIGMKYLAKVADAEVQWAEKASAIIAGKRKSMLTILEERGLVNQITGDRHTFEKRMTDTRLGAYVGIDPTADSLHVGHLLPFITLGWMYMYGFHAVALLGGSTAKIGDPTDRLTTREIPHSSIRSAMVVTMHYQLKKLWINIDTYGKQRIQDREKNDWVMHRELANNAWWWNKQPLLEVLQVLGHGMRLGPMLARETVKNKMKNGDGMSFAEFTYPLLQAWDWWHMFHTKGVHMQIGGADQFGNITAGIDAIKYISKHHPDPVVRKTVEPMGDPIGFTVPLLTTSSGKKLGKSEGNAIWLDSDKTSTFDFYGYFLRTADADVSKYLKMFTFLPIEEIDSLVKQHMEDPKKRVAQHALAREVTELVHGSHEAKVTREQHQLLFQKKPEEHLVVEVPIDSDAKAGQVTLNNKPRANIQLPHSLIHELSIGRILHAAGLATSATDGHRLAAAQNSVYIGGMPHGKSIMIDSFVSWTRIKTWRKEDTAKYLVHGDLLLLRKGKHNIRIIQVVPDAEYKASGKTYPGQKLSSQPPSNPEVRNKKMVGNPEKPSGQVNSELETAE
ncbi:hypothetical protein HYALB_00011746 [Hymenoscyphus albidus]|uniref:Tyrosine--tRNA ligase n=1 Tax=Hymenoscyphus albidus TaxID=595503 RepID=A0A9N9LW85_9HELO|nr:hypothetical protein HYALB_00011746 [Hymenoscyphus albidus]